MQKLLTKYLSLCALLSITVLQAAPRNVAPKYTIRSQGFNSVRRIPGQAYNHRYLQDMGDRENWYGTLSLTPEYTRSFRPGDIANCLFGDVLDSRKRMLKIEGSRTAGRDPNALLADYFYLPTDFKSNVCFTPRIQNFIVDINYYIGLDHIWEGFYFAAQAPLTWTKWALNIRENVCNRGANDHDPGYFTANTLSRDILNENFSQYALGNSPGIIKQSSSTLPSPSNGRTFPQQETTTQLRPLQFAKMRKSKTETSLSEIRYYLGYNFALENDYHVGINLQASAPTGPRPNAEFLFEAQNGNGNHGEFGVGINAHFTCWRSEDEERSWTFDANLDITHLFETRQKRTFDLKNKPLSRYMLATKMGSEILFNLQNDSGDQPSAQFKNFIAPVANITTFDVDVSVGAQIDLLASFRYQHGSMSWDLGYNLYVRTCEDVDLRCEECNSFEEKTWALKGDSHIYGFNIAENAQENGDPNRVFGAIPLSTSQSKADINGGTNFGKNGTIQASEILAAKQNPNIDAPQLAHGDAIVSSSDPLRINFIESQNDTTNPQINTSINPTLIKQEDINFARTKMVTHKLFTNYQYTWDGKETWVPYVGWGAEVEFAHRRDRCCDDDSDDCDSCVRCGVSQWGVFAKIGVSYR